MGNFLNNLESLNDKANEIIWGPITLLFILFVGLWFSIKMRFFQILKFKFWFKSTFGRILANKSQKTRKDKNKISSFQAVSTALAGCVGTGNIIGVATAIYFGGPGALFWMWVAAFLGMMTSFAENTLAIKYQEKDKNNNFVGGPMLWMNKALNAKWLAYIFAFTAIFVTLGMGNMVQANGIANVLEDSFNVGPLVTGVSLAIISGTIILGGIQRIVKFTDKIVPIMVVCYTIASFVVLIYHFDKIGPAFYKILSNAFDFRAVGGSVAGCAAINAMKFGIARGIFSNEAGLGTAPIIHAISHTNEPEKQGMWAIFQVFVDTIVICSATGLSILVSVDLNKNIQGVHITKEAFSSVFGQFGAFIVYTTLVLFAFTTILSWSYIGVRSTSYLFGEKSVKFYKIIACAFIIIGATAELKFLWNLCDNLNAIMMIPNLISLLLLSREIVKNSKIFLKAVQKNS
ncbi:MAG: sodium:alanine symporter family protein [Oscillospiraceae bacterium]|nr:sodium:alanine symporter family protein [Oscillospiraceae bacterium]